MEKTQKEKSDEKYTAFLEMTKKGLKTTGSWPEKQPTLLYRLRGYLFAGGVVIFLVGMCLAVFKSFKNSENLTDSHFFMLTCVSLVVKHIVMVTNKDMFYDLLKQLDAMNSDDNGDLTIYIESKLKTIYFGRSVMFYFTMVAAAFTCFSPFIELPHRVLPAPFPFDMDELPLVFYISTWSFQTITVTCGGFFLAFYDIFMLLLMGMAAAHIRILRDRIRRCFEGSANQNVINKKLSKCVQYHIAIERYINSIEETCRISFLIQIVVDVILTADILFTIALSDQLRDACYDTNWVECDTPVRRSLIIIMERTKRPFKLTAGKLVDMSLDTLVKVLKSSFSYYTVLNQMYGEEE